MQATIDQQKPNPKHFHCILCDKKFDTSHNLANHEKKIHDVGISPNQSQQTAEIVDISSQHRSESDDEFSWDDIKDQKINSNLPSAPLQEVQDVTEIDVDSPDIIKNVEFNKENAQLLMNTFSEVYSKEEKTELYDSYVTSSITVSKNFSINLKINC